MKKNGVSKIRSKKARAQTRNAEKAASGNKGAMGANRRQSAATFLAGLGAWLSALVILHATHDFDLHATTMARLAGDGFLLIVCLVGCGILLRLLAAGVIGNSRNLSILLAVSLLSLLPTLALLHLEDALATLLPWWPTDTLIYLLPLSLAPLLASILIHGRAGLMVGIWVSCVAAIISGRDFDVLLVGLLETVVAALFGRDVRRRSTIFRIGLIVGLSEIFFVISASFLMLPDFAPMRLTFGIIACLSNGVITALVVLLALPLFEALFHITTDIRLLELSDLGSPLLQRLAIEAPGTYHHSLVVANLAQAAANAVSANGLLARVASYYHDIGKLTKPGFFTENIQLGRNPHDELQPSMSTLVITAHVKEGSSLALANKLPQPIIDVIQQHHGTGLVRFFHHKARQQLELELKDGRGDNIPVNEQDYRYPGPKPRSREAAIISLADTVEAASRSLEKVNPGHLESLVDELVNAKLLDGQLDDTDLTMHDLAKIKTSFVFTLTNMLHGRIAYPKDEDTDKQSTEDGQAEQGQDKEADAPPDDQGTENDKE